MISFFNDNFGRFLVKQTGNPVADARHALSSGHRMKSGYKMKDGQPVKTEDGKLVEKGLLPQRIASGWAIIRKDRPPVMQFELAAEEIEYSKKTRYEAFLEVLESWDGTEIMLLEFEKKPIPVENLFRTFDLKHVCVCSPSGVKVFDYTSAPDAPKKGVNRGIHHILWELKNNKEVS